MSARFRQCPGWWPSLVEVVCECGYRGPPHNLNNGEIETVRIRIERDQHDCADYREDDLSRGR